MYLASGTVKKVIEINPYLLGTMAGGAGMYSFVLLFENPNRKVKPTVNTGKLTLVFNVDYTSSATRSASLSQLHLNT